jgi:hypothetical protein
MQTKNIRFYFEFIYILKMLSILKDILYLYSQDAFRFKRYSSNIWSNIQKNRNFVRDIL